MTNSNLFIKLVGNDSDVSTKGFALFRIGFACFITVFIANVYYFKPLVFTSFITLGPNPIPAKLFLALWFTAAVTLIIGYQTRFAAIINYICVVLAAYTFSNNGCGAFNDDLLRIGSFMLLVFPAHKKYSIDAILYSLKNGENYPQTTSRYNYLVAVFISLGLMYWASSITKIVSPIWQKGLGLWIPAVVPQNKWNDIDLLLNQEWLMIGINYLTIIWEFLFIAAIFNRKLRPYFAWIGILFHLCIAAIFPFWLLCFGPLPFYFLLFYDKTSAKTSHTEQLTISYNSSSNRQTLFVRLVQALNTNIKISHTPVGSLQINNNSFNSNWDAAQPLLNKHWYGPIFSWTFKLEFCQLLYIFIADDVLKTNQTTSARELLATKFKQAALIYFSLLLLFVQVFYTTYHLVKNKEEEIKGIDLTEKKYRPRKNISDASLKPANLFRTLLGINARGVFLDHSSIGYKPVFAITYKTVDGKQHWLPHFTPEGYCKAYNMNQMWSQYSFNSVCSGTIPNPIGLQQVITFWAQKNQQSLDSMDFTILKRVYTFPTTFKKDYLNEQKNLPWTPEGVVKWRKGKFSYMPFDTLQNTQN